MYGKIKATIAAITSQPIRYVVNTHFHRDHTGGNEVFGKDGALTVAHENVKCVLASGSRNGLNWAVTPPVSEIALPKQTYSDTMTLQLRAAARCSGIRSTCIPMATPRSTSPTPTCWSPGI